MTDAMECRKASAFSHSIPPVVTSVSQRLHVGRAGIRRGDQRNPQRHRETVGHLLHNHVCHRGTGRDHAGSVAQRAARGPRRAGGLVECRQSSARGGENRQRLIAGAVGRADSVTRQRPAHQRGEQVPHVGAGGLRARFSDPHNPAAAPRRRGRQSSCGSWPTNEWPIVAFSSEVDTGSRQENASKKSLEPIPILSGWKWLQKTLKTAARRVSA